jgi:hypothetical protein
MWKVSHTHIHLILTYFRTLFCRIISLDIICSSLCVLDRMWHRKCVGADSNIATAGSASAAATSSTAAPVSGSSAHTASASHVYPFTPTTTPYWYCNECMSLKGHCFSCFHPGTFDPTLDRIPNPELPNSKKKIENPDYLLQCPFPGGCGKLYHRKCLFELPRTMTHKPSRTSAASKDVQMALTPNLVPRPRAGLVCGLHACHACGAGGTASTNVRDVGRTLIACIRCPAAFHWSTRCRPNEELLKAHTKRFGVCDAHEEEGEDAEDADVIQRRTDSIASLTLSQGIPPMSLWGIEPPIEETEDSQSDEDEEEEEEEDEENFIQA